MPLSQAVPRAILCASLSVTKKGAQSSYPFRSDLNQLILEDGCCAEQLLPPEGVNTTREIVRAALEI